MKAKENGEENNGQTSQDRKGQRSIRVQSSSSDTSRTTSDSTVRKESSTNTNGSTRNTNLSGSIRDSYERSTVSDEGRTEPIDKPSKERQLNEGNLLKQDKVISKEKASRLDDIKHDLPILLPEQQGDVLFAEERLIENKKPGVMFTYFLFKSLLMIGMISSSSGVTYKVLLFVKMTKPGLALDGFFRYLHST